jgi:hypothetical protein
VLIYIEAIVLYSDSLPKQIKVEAYSGYKANERPLYILLDRSRLAVRDIIARWYDVDHDFFKILADDGKSYQIRWNRESDVWTLEEVSSYSGA